MLSCGNRSHNAAGLTICGTDIFMVRGDSIAFTVGVEYDDPEGTAYPLAEGDTIEFTVRKSPKSSDMILHRVVTEFDEGVAQIDIRPEDTESVPFGEYVYGIRLTLADGTVYAIVPCSTFGIMEVVPHG